MSRYFTILRDIENFSKNRLQQLAVEEKFDDYLRLGFDTCHEETVKYVINSRTLNRRQSRLLYTSDINSYAEVTQKIIDFNGSYYENEVPSNNICDSMRTFNTTWDEFK